MAAKGWFSVRTTEKSLVCYLVSADNETDVRNIANSLSGKPTIKQLTWHGLKELTGCIIPIGQQPQSLAHGNFMIRKMAKPDIVLWPL